MTQTSAQDFESGANEAEARNSENLLGPTWEYQLPYTYSSPKWLLPHRLKSWFDMGALFLASELGSLVLLIFGVT